jgi:Lon protease-like protein
MYHFDPDRFSGRVGLFPLPTVVLVPYEHKAFHLFEPRYRALLRDALQGEGLIAVPMLKPGWESDYEGRPPVHEVCGVGLIKHHRPYPDGRGDILLAGVARARIVRESSELAYRTATVEILEDVYPEGDDLHVERERLLDRVCAEKERCHEDISAGMAADLVLAQLPIEPAERQRVLEELDVGRRIAAIHCILDRLDAARKGAPREPRPPKRPDLN